MKVVTAKEMARIEGLAYQAGASEEAFMEEAGRRVAEAVMHAISRYHLTPHITLLCGKGNNAGDAYVAGRILLQGGGYHVDAYTIAKQEECSHLCTKMRKQFIAEGGKVRDLSDPMDFSASSLLVDGLLGTGFHGELATDYRRIIDAANSSGKKIIAVDIPSGINGTTGEFGQTAIEATETVFLGLPKSGCFLGQAWNYVGKFRLGEFGLQQNFIEKAQEEFNLIDDALAKSLLPKITRNRHKYQAGYVVGVGGSPAMPGAPILSSYATLRAGAGIVRLLHPEGMEAQLGAAPAEIIRQGYGDVKPVLQALEKAKAAFVGPGLGKEAGAVRLLKKLLPEIKIPCVIDADALSIIGEENLDLPSQAILTPHHGEMQRLLRAEQEKLSIAELLSRAQSYVDSKNVVLVLKGSPTFIFTSGKKPYVMGHGDPGMATAGSGDVLTGIIAAQAAQGLSPLNAALLGTYLHGLAGEYAAEKYTSYSMIAGDITNFLPKVFSDLVRTSCAQNTS